MDAATNTTRKRARDDHEVADDNAEILQSKKQAKCLNPIDPLNDDDDGGDEKPYEFRDDGIRVFDFPWLKDGVVFSSEAYFEDHDDKFAPNCCSYLDDDVGVDSNSSQNLSISPSSDDGENGGGDYFWSSLVGDSDRDLDLDSVDCIWSCVIDHPLDLGFSKGSIVDRSIDRLL